MSTAAATTVLRGLESFAGIFAAAQSLPAPWGLVLSAGQAALGLAADLVERGANPVQAITRLRSALAAFQGADAELDAYLEELARLQPKAP